MRGYKACLSFGLSVVLCVLLTACPSGKPPAHIDPLVIVKTKPTPAYVGVSYSFTFAATGGLTPYTWSISSGSLPAGLTLNESTGTVSGSPTTAASYTFTVQCTDSQTPTAAVETQSFTMVITKLTPLSVLTTTLPNATINQIYNTSLQATGGVPPYTWSITSGSLPAGLSLNSSGMISGTATALDTSTFTVQVADSESTPATVTANLSLTVAALTPVTVTTTTLSTGTTGMFYGAVLSASGGVPPYSWQIASGSLPMGLSLSAGGTLSGTPTAPGTSTFTLQVTDSTMPTAQTATANLSITVSNPGQLGGSYAFYFNGFNAGSPVFMAGNFVADGSGNITSGVLDLTNSSGTQSSIMLTGSNTYDSTTSLGSVNLMAGSLGALTWQLAQPANSPVIRFIQNNPNNSGSYGSGVIKKQDPTSFSVSSLAGNYAFGWSGVDSAGGRLADVGSYTTDQNGNLTAGAADINDAGTVSQMVALTGSYGQTVDATSGRGTATLAINGATSNFTFYVVSSSEIFMLETESTNPENQLVGSAEKQLISNSGSNNNLGGNAILELSGLQSSSPDVIVGLGGFTASNSSFTLNTDENAAGTLTSLKYSGSYAVNSTTGRVTFNNNAFPAVMYLSVPNTAFVLGTDSSVKSGTLEPQAAISRTITGEFLGGSVAPVLSSVVNEVDSTSASSPNAFRVTYDISGPGGSQQGLTQAETYTIDNHGRTVVTNSSVQTVDIFYIVNSSKLAGITAETSPKLVVQEH